MNIEQARNLTLAQILETLGYKPSRDKRGKAVYSFPLRNENTSSFHVDHRQNVWYDFGIGEGGSVLEFVCAYLKSTNEPDTISDALSWLSNLSGQSAAIRSIPAGD